MRVAAHPSGCARCGVGAGCSAIKYQRLLRHDQRVEDRPEAENQLRDRRHLARNFDEILLQGDLSNLDDPLHLIMTSHDRLKRLHATPYPPVVLSVMTS